jgi:hypothetical protein
MKNELAAALDFIGKFLFERRKLDSFVVHYGAYRILILKCQVLVETMYCKHVVIYACKSQLILQAHAKSKCCRHFSFFYLH